MLYNEYIIHGILGRYLERKTKSVKSMIMCDVFESVHIVRATKGLHIRHPSTSVYFD